MYYGAMIGMYALDVPVPVLVGAGVYGATCTLKAYRSYWKLEKAYLKREGLEE